MSKYTITKTHRAILQDAITASNAPLKLTINDHGIRSTYVEISYPDKHLNDEAIIANACVGRYEYFKTSSELVSYILGEVMWWACRGKREYHKRITNKELYVRDRFLGIRKILTAFQPVTYFFRDGNQNIGTEQRAEFAANHLKTKQWGNSRA